MKMSALITRTLITLSCLAIGQSEFVLKESMNIVSESVSATKIRPVALGRTHSVVIAVYQKNIPILHEMLVNRSNQIHPHYQKWLSYTRIGQLIQNNEAYELITTWLTQNRVQIIDVTPHKNYITARASIGTFNRLFNTTYYSWKDNRNGGNATERYVLTESYKVPAYLNTSIAFVFGTCQLPPIIRHHSYVKGPAATKSNKYQFDTETFTYTTVSLLNKIYGVTSNIG